MSESHNTRFGSMKQDILVFKNEFTSSTDSLKSSIDEKFNLVNETVWQCYEMIKKCGSYSC